MRNIVRDIFEKKFEVANLQIQDKIQNLIEQKLVEMKKKLGATISEDHHIIAHGRSYNKDAPEEKWKIDSKRYKIKAKSSKHAIDKALKKIEKDYPNHQEYEAQHNNDPDYVHEDWEYYVEDLGEINEETEVLDEKARIRIVRARIRNGKVQRRKKVSNIKGYTMRKKAGGPPRLIRMSPIERRKRRLGQRRGKIKRRAKRARIRQRTKRSLRKRHSIGLR